LEVDKQVKHKMKDLCAFVEYEYQLDSQLSKITGGLASKYVASGILSAAIVKYMVTRGYVRPAWKGANLATVALMLLQMQGAIARIAESVHELESKHPVAATLLGNHKILYHYFKGAGWDARMKYWTASSQMDDVAFSFFTKSQLCVCNGGQWLPASHKEMSALYLLPFKR
jgi:hypothetical protein